MRTTLIHRVGLRPSRTAVGGADSPRGGAAVPGPESVEIRARHLRVGDGYTASFTVVGYPAEVGAGWLEPLLCYPGRLDVALHIDPIPPATAAAQLRKQLGRLESSRRSSMDRGRLEDPETEVAADDAAGMAAALARGESKLFTVGLYLTVHAATKPDLDAEVEQVKALCASMLLDAQPTSYRSLQAWTSTLPLGVDSLGTGRTLDTPALATAFPFTSPDLPIDDPSPNAQPSGVLYGLNATGSGLIVWNRWEQDNYNSVTLARSGSGKSYATKLEALRSLYDTADGGIQVFVIDPEDEYARLSATVGGTYLHLGEPGVRINPFDLPDGVPDALVRQAMFAHTLLPVMLGAALTPAETAALDRAVIAAYNIVGITADPRTWGRPAPLLANLTDQLSTLDGPGPALAERLAPYVTGSYRGLFDGPTTRQPDGHLVVLSLRDLPDELRAVGTLLALNAVWRRVLNPRRRRRRLVVVDEAWMLMAQPDGARFLARMARSARKYWAGLAFVSQDASDILSTDLGKAIVNNAATQVLLRQAPQAIDTIADAFRLSDGERTYLLTAARGDALLIAGTNRVAFTTVASPFEDSVVTTNPADLHALDSDRDDLMNPGGLDDPWHDGDDDGTWR